IDLICGAPGVYSSRYAGENATYDENCNKLLEEMKDLPEGSRQGGFKTVICYFENPENVHYFKGEVRGKILTTKRGESGFGYDPLFVPDGFDKTYAEMNAEEKNMFSHRAKALEKFAEFLKNKKTGN
ncbi:MAG TPA: non-canonical purine NTP pyrophosphatase, partial [Ignavibacteria bacterium]|nr:non-canonical purine NTP pyrophosphatase [Ignavibacteria bacterium]